MNKAVLDGKYILIKIKGGCPILAKNKEGKKAKQQKDKNKELMRNNQVADNAEAGAQAKKCPRDCN